MCKVTLLLIHIVSGSLAVGVGFGALLAAKGSLSHRRFGSTFVVTMLVMTSSGAMLAALAPSTGSVLMGLFAFYLTLTSWLTVRDTLRFRRGLEIAASVGLAAVVGAAVLLARIAASPDPGVVDFGAGFYHVVGAMTAAHVLGDLRRFFTNEVSRVQRLTRHLWRMNLALGIAAMSIFLGQARLFPNWAWESGLLFLPLIVVALMTIFWLVRLRWPRRRTAATV